jgi:hypothetical protein
MAAAGADAAELPLSAGVDATLAVIAGLGGLRPGDAEILGYTARLVLAPRTMRAAHLTPLRASGLSDDEIHDVCHVACCFSYMNRLADGLGVIQGELKRPWAIELLGEAAFTSHLEWGSSDDG